jgi:hypothetical protein
MTGCSWIVLFQDGKTWTLDLLMRPSMHLLEDLRELPDPSV